VKLPSLKRRFWPSAATQTEGGGAGQKKDPRTGKRVSRINPESDWQTTAVPHLRIVDAEMFSAAQERLNARAH
jgi:hypothetical protein